MKANLLWIFLVFFACTPSAKTEVDVVDMDQLESLYSKDQNTLYVVNFWATWCKPCVQEMPLFNKLSQKEMAGVEVIMVSLDFPEDMDKKLKPFLEQRKLHPKVVLLDAGNPNDWIDRVSPEWGGAIPGTLFIRESDNLREFYEGEFQEGELQDYVNELLKNKTT